MFSKIFNSPKNFIVFVIFVLFVALCGVLGIHYWMSAQGLPEIEARVNKQLNVLSIQNSNFQGIKIGEIYKRTLGKEDGKSYGIFTYNATKKAEYVHIQVYWAGDINDAHIVKINLWDENPNPQILWKDTK